MLFDILAVFVVTFLSSLFLRTASLQGLPTSSSNLYYIDNHPSAADVSSSLRLIRHQPVPSVDYDLGGDISQMLLGEGNDLSRANDYDDKSSSLSSSSSSSVGSSFDASNEQLKFYLNSSPSKLLTRKFLLSLKKQHQQKEDDEDEEQKKRSTSSSTSTTSPQPTQFDLNAAIAKAAFADSFNANKAFNISRLSESTRLSPSLKILVQTNPFARAWLTMLLQKPMEEQPVPYIFKYGRRRKK